VYDAAVNGSEQAKQVFRVMGTYLGIAFAGLVNVLNPEMIVIGGGVSSAWEFFIDFFIEELRKRSFREPFERVKIVRAELGDDAGILGAARSALSIIN
jgi:glucokinase